MKDLDPNYNYTLGDSPTLKDSLTYFGKSVPKTKYKSELTKEQKERAIRILKEMYPDFKP